jgi:poly(A) polymerase
MVGGAVRDLLLHRVHNDPWRGLPDLDLVVEGVRGEAAAVGLAQALERSGRVQVRGWREHGAYGTVEFELQLAE